MKNGVVRALSIGLLGSGAMLLSQVSLAAERGFYVGAFYSQNKKDADVAPFQDFVTFVYDYFSFIPTQSTTSFDAKDSGYGFFGGYRLFNNLRV